ncbi:hypothetical protein A8C56_19400 [Niabella ginsenosidivorans]|uniref:Xylose isomerase n=1 Tax=Niabella ginsenosidivorans TaxID=1176587 RepID=A0A1A9I5M5_9BACT|nr:hypothetical protein [Niabella ginsenosidivorans]ANH82863.1 hypothetical protein A8C56_19400 [Niabella ginsenosidivorans]
MKIRYICPHWGQEYLAPEQFIENVIDAGYSGIEINIGALRNRVHWMNVLQETREQYPEFIVIGQMVPEERYNRFNLFYKEMQQRLALIADFNPVFINSHTGKDFFSFNENCLLLELATTFSKQSGIPVYHETHRGRFSYALHLMPPYLKQFPGLGLVADYSHWCNVSESLLHDQSETLRSVIPHIRHIHARIGYEQSPQLADPFVPHYKNYLDTFTNWWKDILLHYQKKELQFTICTEAGPAPYMPVNPATGRPLANQWQINTAMLRYLKETFAGFTA